MSRFDEFDFSDIKRRSITERQSKVFLDMFASAPEPGELRPFAKKLPKILNAEKLLEFADHIEKVAKGDGFILAMIGGHVIKCGLAPILADLAKRGYIHAIAGNGSIAIHDVEIALFGETSEAVENEIDDGMFGMTRETADFINMAQKTAARRKIGLGEMLGEKLGDAPNREYSIIWQMYNLGLPITIHPMLGAEVIHPHPNLDGAALGEVAYTDFRIFTNNVTKLGGKIDKSAGVVMNLGSAVIMPELFVKALSAARNRGFDVSGIYSANFDQIQHYRPTVNVLKRPTQTGGKYFAFTGHHEIMIPLMAGLLR